MALVSAVDVALKQLSLPTSLSRSSKITVAMLERLMHNTCMNRLDNARRSQVIRCLVEGTSVRATVRMTGVAKKTVLRLLCEIGESAARCRTLCFAG